MFISHACVCASAAPIPAVWAQGRCVSTHSFTRPSICRRAPKLRVEAQASNGASTVKLIMQGRRLPVGVMPCQLASFQLAHTLHHMCHTHAIQIAIQITTCTRDWALTAPSKHLHLCHAAQLTNSIRSYVEEKVLHALAYYAHQVRQVDVTLSARGGDTGTKGPRQQKVDVTVFTLRRVTPPRLCHGWKEGGHVGFGVGVAACTCSGSHGMHGVGWCDTV